jgi:hypothetical protein
VGVGRVYVCVRAPSPCDDPLHRCVCGVWGVCEGVTVALVVLGRNPVLVLVLVLVLVFVPVPVPVPVPVHVPVPVPVHVHVHVPVLIHGLDGMHPPFCL